MNIHVGNISPKTSKWQIRMTFERYGQVGKINMVDGDGDGDTNRSCHLEMLFDHHGTMAIKKLNGTLLGGNVLTIRKTTTQL